MRIRTGSRMRIEKAGYERYPAQTVDKSPISSERDWTFSMYKMKINVEIPIIKTANMI